MFTGFRFCVFRKTNYKKKKISLDLDRLNMHKEFTFRSLACWLLHSRLKLAVFSWYRISIWYSNFKHWQFMSRLARFCFQSWNVFFFRFDYFFLRLHNIDEKNERNSLSVTLWRKLEWRIFQIFLYFKKVTHSVIQFTPVQCVISQTYLKTAINIIDLWLCFI